MPARTSFLFYFSFIQQFFLWYLWLGLLIVLPWSKFMSFPIWSAWKRHVHRNMESAVWAISPWGCDTHPMKNHICVLFMDLTWHTTAQSSSLLGMSRGLFFTIKLVPWFHPSCFQILNCLRRCCLNYAYHFLFSRRRDSPSWMQLKSGAVTKVFTFMWQCPLALP